MADVRPVVGSLEADRAHALVCLGERLGELFTDAGDSDDPSTGGDGVTVCPSRARVEDGDALDDRGLRGSRLGWPH